MALLLRAPKASLAWPIAGSPCFCASTSDPTAVEVFARGPGVGKFERLAAKEKGEEPKLRFLETVLDALEAIGVPDERMHRESYG